MRPSRFRQPVAYLQRPTRSRPFFSLPPFPVSRFGSSNNSIKDDNRRQNSSSHDEDEPEGNEEETQRYHERKIMPYSEKELYNLVADVDSYRHFLPFCNASKVLNASRPNWKSNPGDGPVALEAELKVGFLGLEESYVSRVSCNPYESVEARAATSTPLFKTLITTWRFQPASLTPPHPSTSSIHPLTSPVNALSPSDGIHANQPDDLRAQTAPTLLMFDIVFAFSNPLHASVSSAFFGRVSKMMVRAFEERCIDVYGLGTR